MKTVDEFKGMKPEDVVKYIEGEPSISVVPVEPGLANMEKTDATGQRIVGLNTENAEINEGLVRIGITNEIPEHDEKYDEIGIFLPNSIFLKNLERHIAKAEAIIYE